MKKINEYSGIVEALKDKGFMQPERFYIRWPNARPAIEEALKHFVGEKAQWLPEYDKVVQWMDYNHGRGLFMFGANGRGKTIMAKTILPAIFLRYMNKVLRCYDSQQMNTNLEDILKLRILSLDDIGTEDVRIVFGEKRWAFPEIMDMAEKRGSLLIITSNLGAEALQEKYGIRTIERIKATCVRVLFDGKSLRQ